MIQQLETRPTHFLACKTCTAASDHLREARKKLRDENRPVLELCVSCEDIQTQNHGLPATAAMTIYASYDNEGEEGKSEPVTLNGNQSNLVRCIGAL